jgi:hypothetical protein
MQEIRPSLEQQDILCAEIPAPPNAMVVFGASGVLSHRKPLPSIFQIYTQDLLDEKFYLLGCGRKKLSDKDFCQIAQQAISVESSSIVPHPSSSVYCLNSPSISAVLASPAWTTTR